MLAYTARTKDQIRERHLRRKYGLSLTEYNALLEKQGHGCAICGATIGEPTRNRRLFVDHDHTTGKIRGLLCYRCNAILGLIKDRPDYLRRLANYLEPDSARKGRRDNRT